MASMNRVPVFWLVVSLFGGSAVLGQNLCQGIDETAGVECGSWLMDLEMPDSFPIISPATAIQSGTDPIPLPEPTPPAPTLEGCLDYCESTPGCNAASFKTTDNSCQIMTIPLFQPSTGLCGSQLYRMCPKPDCGEWAFGTAYVGPLLGSTDPPAAPTVTGTEECKTLCLNDYFCDVATFYDTTRECALRAIPGSSPHNVLQRGVHSLVKCVPTGCGVWIPRVDYEGGSLGMIDVTNFPAEVVGPQAECERRCDVHADCQIATYYPATLKCGLWRSTATVSTKPNTGPVYSFVKCGEGEMGGDGDMGDGPDDDDGEEDGSPDDEDEEDEEDEEDANCGRHARIEGRYRNGSGCARYNLPNQSTLNNCRKACEEGGFKFCSWKTDANGNSKPCAAFIEEKVQGQSVNTGACTILANNNAQKKWDSFETCGPWRQEHEQCGGIGYTGQNNCVEGLECVAEGDYWSACKTPIDDTCENAEWAQCGGQDFKGKTCCPKGAACVPDGAYYSQCINIHNLSKEQIQAVKDAEDAKEL